MPRSETSSSTKERDVVSLRQTAHYIRLTSHSERNATSRYVPIAVKQLRITFCKLFSPCVPRLQYQYHR